MFRSHHITLILADERRRELVRLGQTVSVRRHPATQPERKTEARFLEPVERDPAPTSSPRKATIRVWRPGGVFRSRTHDASERPVRERELDRV